MNLGERETIDGNEFECTATGRLEGDAFDCLDGRVPTEDDAGILLECEGEPGVVYWLEPVGQVERRERVARLEMEIDAVLDSLRGRLIQFEESDDDVPVEVVGQMLRVACAKGYMYALWEEPRAALAMRAGYDESGVAL